MRFLWTKGSLTDPFRKTFRRTKSHKEGYGRVIYYSIRRNTKTAEKLQSNKFSENVEMNDSCTSKIQTSMVMVAVELRVNVT